MLLTRVPRPALRPFVRQLWAIEPDPAASAAPSREHVLPTGHMHLAFRLSGPALRVFDSPQDVNGRRLGHAVVGGAPSSFYVREIGIPGRSLGAQLEPHGALLLLGAPADALAGRHTLLQDLWGYQCELTLERLATPHDAQRRLDVLEDLLAQRLPAVHGLHPAVAQALAGLRAGSSVEHVVGRSGYSHRHLLTLFRQATGLAPKEYGRLLRLQAVLGQLAVNSRLPWAALALQAGYSDQAHFSREFSRFAGLTPQAWRRAASRHPHHVLLARP